MLRAPPTPVDRTEVVAGLGQWTVVPLRVLQPCGLVACISGSAENVAYQAASLGHFSRQPISGKRKSRYPSAHPSVTVPMSRRCAFASTDCSKCDKPTVILSIWPAVQSAHLKF